MKRLLLLIGLLFWSCEDSREVEEPRELIQMWLDGNEIPVYDYYESVTTYGVKTLTDSGDVKKVFVIHFQKEFGRVLLFDCHSIRSRLPFLFEGELPNLNLGTNNTTTCDPKIEEEAVKVCSSAKGYSYAINGRFKGGWTTRNYGNPEKGIHAIQLEISQKTYMTETYPWLYNVEKASRLRYHLKKLLIQLEETILNLS